MACIRKVRGQYRVDFRDEQGRRYRRFFKTRRAANSLYVEVQGKIKSGTFVSPRDIPTFTQISEEWFTSKTAGSFRPSSLSFWRGHLDNHLLPDLGTLQLNRIDIGTLEKFAAARRATGLSPASVNKLLTTASAIFKYAMRRKLVVTNPASDADRQKGHAGELVDGAEAARVGDEVREDEVLTPAEIALLLQHADTGFYRTLFQVAALTGARHDELLALQWDDIDLETEKITIRRSLSWAKLKDEPARHRFFAPKTPSGRRTLPIPSDLVHALKVWKLQCPKGELDLVFPTPAGTPAHRSNILRRGLYPALQAAKLRRVDMHSLRHSFASALIAAGRPVTEVQHYLGHANPSTTLRVYSHWFKSTDSTAIEDLARSIFAPSKSAQIR